MIYNIFEFFVEVIFKVWFINFDRSHFYVIFVKVKHIATYKAFITMASCLDIVLFDDYLINYFCILYQGYDYDCDL